MQIRYYELDRDEKKTIENNVINGVSNILKEELELEDDSIKIIENEDGEDIEFYDGYKNNRDCLELHYIIKFNINNFIIFSCEIFCIYDSKNNEYTIDKIIIVNNRVHIRREEDYEVKYISMYELKDFIKKEIFNKYKEKETKTNLKVKFKEIHKSLIKQLYNYYGTDKNRVNKLMKVLNNYMKIKRKEIGIVKFDSIEANSFGEYICMIKYNSQNEVYYIMPHAMFVVVIDKNNEILNVIELYNVFSKENRETMMEYINNVYNGEQNVPIFVKDCFERTNLKNYDKYKV